MRNTGSGSREAVRCLLQKGLLTLTGNRPLHWYAVFPLQLTEEGWSRAELRETARPQQRRRR